MLIKGIDMQPVLVVQHLKKIYPSTPPFVAVNDISFKLEKGEILGLLGPNGSGKTTTIQMLLGTLTLTSGSITYFGKDFTTHRSEILQYISFASTYTSLPSILTLEENLEVFGCLYGFSRKESAKRFDPLLERFGIYNKKYKRTAELSAGQITRLMLVKAFFIQPKIVLLDEPTASLDPDIARDICSFLLEQRDKSDLSILFCSHKMQEVMEICDRSIFLKAGKIIADDVPETLAKSVSNFTITMIITSGLEKTIEVVKHNHFPYKTDHKTIEIVMTEEDIPKFLQELSKRDVNYANIRIDEPSLEDFFLQIAKD